MIKAIFAVDDNDGFALNGGLPWNDPDDLAYFKQVTTGHVVVMGSSTYKSIPGGKGLPDRVNVVISWNEHENYPNRISGGIIEILGGLQAKYPDKDIFVIGGKSVLLQSRLMIDELYITYIKGTHEVDTWFDTKAYLGQNPMTSNIKFNLKSVKNCETNSKAIYERDCS